MPRLIPHAPLRVLVPALVVITFAGCSSGSTGTSTSASSSVTQAPSGGDTGAPSEASDPTGPTDASAPSDPGGATEADFCRDYRAAGGTGATVGPVQVWAGRDAVLADVGSSLTAMNAVEAPTEVEAQWNTMKSYYERVAAAFEATDPDPAVGIDEQTLVGELSAEEAALTDDYEAVTSYYFATC